MNIKLFTGLDDKVRKEILVVLLCITVRSDLATGVHLVRSTEDCVLWLKISKEILHSDKDLLICTCYILPTNSGRRNITCDVLEKNNG